MLQHCAEVSMIRTMRGWMLVVGLGAGCYAGEAQYSGTATITPDLAYVAPGVQVIADYDEPIFFADGFYWWSVDGHWYRSTYYTGGWAYAPSPPVVVLGLRDPFRYRRYRPQGYVVRHRPVPTHRVQRPARHAPASRPHVRDHRR